MQTHQFSDTSPPLAGTRVLEISSFVAAPLGAMTLAQLGAEVIRIDPVGGAADQHRWPLAKSGTSLYWAGLNKGKRSLSIDLHSDRGQSVVHELLRQCPRGSAVVVTNSVGRDWLAPAKLRQSCPDLIHVQVQGNRDGSPAVDYTVNAEIGFPLVTGPQAHADPINHVLPAWDIACGLYAALGAVAAVRRRDLTGLGDDVSIALQDVAFAMAGNLGYLAEAQVNGVERSRIGNHLYGGFARDFTCSDGVRFMVVALTAGHWNGLLKMTDCSEPVAALESSLGRDFSIETDRFEYREALAGLIQGWFAARTGEEVKRALAETRLLWSQYQTFSEAIANTTVDREDSLLKLIDQPGVGVHLAPGLPTYFASHRTEVTEAPVLGQHNQTILTEAIGLDTTEISLLTGTTRLPQVATFTKEQTP